MSAFSLSIKKNNRTLRNFWLSLIGIPIIGISLPLVFGGLRDLSSDEILYVLFFSIITTATIWEVNNLIVSYFSKQDLTANTLGTRFLRQLFVCGLFAIGIVTFFYYLSRYLFPNYSALDKGLDNLILTAATLTLLINAAYQGLFYLRRWRFSFMRTEVLKRATLRAQYEILKHQVNPYFLFSSLNALKNLVKTNKDEAVNYVQELAAVYRYVLQTKDIKSIELHKEAKFVDMYVYLLGVRYGNGLQVKFDLKKEDEKLKLPPLTLQILVENAVKYNEISREKPLFVNITSELGYITVSNNLQLRKEVEEYTKIGLKNIQEKYSTISKRNIEITKTQTEFVVKVPLLN